MDRLSEISKLKRAIDDLQKRRDDGEQLVEAAQRRLEQPTEEVKGWLLRASEIINDGRRIEAAARGNMSQEDRTVRYKPSKEVAEKVIEAVDHHRKINLHLVSYAKSSPEVQPWPISEWFEELASVKSYKAQIMEALRDKGIRVIGVFGMAGVGKTTLMKYVNNGLQGTRLFNKVVVVTVSKDPNIASVQDRIANRLDLQLERDSELHGRAFTLSRRLNKEKPFLVIMDDVWNPFDVADIGGPYEGCKIILTTRNEKICLQMDAQICIKVETLSKQSSQILFARRAGDVVTISALQPIAEKIVDKCGGLPLAIVALGSSMKGERDESVWRTTLWALENSEPAEVDGMPEVIRSLTVSYDRLSNAEIKSCFLFCCLFHKDIYLEDLLRYGFSGGFLKANGDLEVARGKLHTYVKKLKELGLLLEGEDKFRIKMHDVVRDVAISIGSAKEHGYFVKAGLGLDKWPGVELGECTTISLIDNRIQTLPDQLECPQLVTLLLQGNYSLTEIPVDFFSMAKALVTLDLSDTGISSLPPSISCLKNLRTLRLDACQKLNHISFIGELKKLEIFSLWGSHVQELPRELESLTNLKVLDLTACELLDKIPANTLSRLSGLQELYMSHSFRDWELEGRRDRSQASFTEVASLASLTTLCVQVANSEISVEDIPALTSALTWKNLKKFRIIFYPSFRGADIGGEKYNAVLCLYRSITIASWMKDLLKKTEVLLLSDYYDHENFVNLLPLLENLKELEINICDELQDVFHLEGLGQGHHSILSNLRELRLVCLPQMTRLWVGNIPCGSLKSLERLYIYGCPRLENVFTEALTLFDYYDHKNFAKLVPILENLEELEMNTCQELPEVFHLEGHGQGHHPILSNLKELTLGCLPQMRTLWLGNIQFGSLKSLERLYINWCPRLENVFSPPLAVALQKLETLAISYCNEVVRLISDENGEVLIGFAGSEVQLPIRSNSYSLPSPMLPNLQKLSIIFCDSFKHLLTWSIAQRLPLLKSLNVFRCKSMENIIATQGEEGNRQGIIFPCLTTLYLTDLPTLKSFCQEKIVLDLPSLECIEVFGCPNLRRLPLGVQSAPNLKRICGEEEWLKMLEFAEQKLVYPDMLKSRFQPLFVVEEYEGFSTDEEDESYCG